MKLLIEFILLLFNTKVWEFGLLLQIYEFVKIVFALLDEATNTLVNYIGNVLGKENLRTKISIGEVRS